MGDSTYAARPGIAAARKEVTAKTSCIRTVGSGILYHDDPTSPEGGAPMTTIDPTFLTMTGGADLGVALGGPSGANCA
jgi:hypothetical protein